MQKATMLRPVGLLGMLVLLAGTALAQPLRLDDLPPTSGNDRFFHDEFAIRHPSLSLNGFACNELETRGCDAGLGLAEVLHSVYDDPPAASLHMMFEQALAHANADLIWQPSSRGEIIDNTFRIQARAFVALVTYLLEQNGNDLAALNTRTQGTLPDHDEAMRRLKEAVLEPELYSVAPGLDADAVKWPGAVTNMARSFDLYLALENAYDYYGDADYDDTESDRLLSCFEKGAWVSHMAFSMRALDDLARREVLPGIRLDEVQPGNWPMKVQVALGYGALAQQAHEGTCYPTVRIEYINWLYRAMNSAGAPTGQNRSKHWAYQTDNGKRFFAEGPYYFHLTLSEILPFWHTLRLNNLLDIHPDFNPGDPFHSDWFTQPLHWLADLATPDGQIPALDDGNKIDLRDAAFMRWTPAYGDPALGRKMAWIADRQPRDWGVSRSLLFFEMAIPRLGTDDGQPPEPNIGNTTPQQTGEDGEQQLIIRRTATDGEHYVLLNGESGDAITRGEGHEQGDQMQLLYYVDEVSYLLDTGYDKATGLTNSTWNHYRDHNVMTMALDQGNGEGGVQPPFPSITRQRIVADHQPMRALYRTSSGRLDFLHAEIDLDPDNDYKSGPQSTYRRTVLFVHDPDAPYLIDLNAITGPSTTPMRYAMRYHGNADALSHTPGANDYALWQGLWAKDDAAGKTDASLFLQPFSVEYPLKTTTTTSHAQETLNGVRTIKRLDVESGPAGFAETQDHTTVAFLRALPGGGEPATRPVAGRASQNDPQPWRFFTWQHDAETVDVFAARSAAVHREPSLRTDEVLHITTPTGRVKLTFAADDDYGFARLRHNGIRWTIDPAYQHQLHLEGSNPVAVERANVPAYFRLDANVPNPFSETTEIRFALPLATHVTLAIYDLNGREVARLLDAQQAPGYHSINWDAGHLASGVYLARLTAGAFIETQRLVFQK